MKRSIILLATLFASSALWAMTPPAYLSVYKWKMCVGKERVRSAKMVCLPSERPYGCPKSSWRELKYSGMVRCDDDDDDRGIGSGMGSSAPVGMGAPAPSEGEE